MTKTHQTTDSTPRSPETALWQAALEQVLKDAIIPLDCPERQEACAFLTAPDNTRSHIGIRRPRSDHRPRGIAPVDSDLVRFAAAITMGS